MTGELDDMFNAELNNLVPGIWTKDGIGYPCLKPLNSWFEDMILRFAFFRDWIEQGIPIAYWISSFYFPQGFLTSVLQGYSRSTGIPVDMLSFEFVLQDTSDPNDLEGAAEEGIYIHGLFMASRSSSGLAYHTVVKLRMGLHGATRTWPLMIRPFESKSWFE